MMVGFSSVTRLLLAALTLTALLTGCEEGGSEDSGSDGAGGVSIAGAYKSSCTQISGSAVTNGNYKYNYLTFQANGNFSWTTYWTTDSTCATTRYSSHILGTYTIGSSTTTPANGYAVTFSVDSHYIAARDASGVSALSSGCGNGGQYTYSPAGSLQAIYSAYNCANASVVAPSTTLYNVFTINSSAIYFGVPTGDNPGVSNANSVTTNSSVTYTKQ